LRGQYGAKHLNYDIEAFGENYYVQLILLIGFLCVHTISPVSIFNKKNLKFFILNKIEVSDADVGLIDTQKLKSVDNIKTNSKLASDDQVIYSIFKLFEYSKFETLYY
jgi:hypothetical protein